MAYLCESLIKKEVSLKNMKTNTRGLDRSLFRKILNSTISEKFFADIKLMTNSNS